MAINAASAQAIGWNFPNGTSGRTAELKMLGGDQVCVEFVGTSNADLLQRITDWKAKRDGFVTGAKKIKSSGES